MRKSPSDHHIHNIIPDIYQNQFIDVCLWSWVTASIKQGISKQEAVIQFREHFGLDEDSAPISNMLTKYWRLNNQYISAHRTLGRVIIRIPESDQSGLSLLAPILESLTQLVAESRK